MNTDFDIRGGASPEEFARALHGWGVDLPVQGDMRALREPLTLGGKTIPNRICIQPLEGFDSAEDGSPTELVRRRYRRFAESGAGLVWFESAAVSDDGKSNPHQMMLSPRGLPAFRALLEDMDRISLEKFGRRPWKVLQLTHSGRMSRGGDWTPRPVAARRRETDPDESIVASDERIYLLMEELTEHAVMARDAGFDAVDIKACHGYFLSELLGAHERRGDFGGSFENRTRPLLKTLEEICARVGDSLALTVRLNAFDSTPYPGGWGLRQQDGVLVPDLEEPARLCALLRDRGVSIINISASQPRQRLFGGDPDPRAKPYTGACDLMAAARELKHRVPGVYFVGTGLSQFRQFGPAVGAGGIRDGWFDFAGFGRQALAYPAFAEAALSGQLPDPDKCCILCSSCFRLMDPGHCAAGCVVRDPELYGALYRENVLNRKKQ